VLVGSVGVFLKSVFDVTLLTRWAELSVGFVLIGIGGWAILQMRSIVVHAHPHGHARVLAAVQGDPSATDSVSLPLHVPVRSERHLGAPHESHLHSAPPVAHAHLHVHTPKEKSRPATWHEPARSSYWVGLLHGAAGTGHLLGVIPSLALPPALGAAYLLCYGVAAVFAMGCFGFFMGLVGNRVSATWLRRFMFTCGLVAIGVGVFWIYASYGELSRS
jgi:hypothetical protein